MLHTNQSNRSTLRLLLSFTAQRNTYCIVNTPVTFVGFLVRFLPINAVAVFLQYYDVGVKRASN